MRASSPGAPTSLPAPAGHDQRGGHVCHGGARGAWSPPVASAQDFINLIACCRREEK